MFLKALVALLPVGLILISSEILWRKKIIRGERARKFIHILAGVWMAFWPFYLPFDGIFVLSSMALVLALYSRVTRLFHAIYSVKRKTYGDLLYLVALMVCAYLGVEPWIFTVSILLLAVADGGAAVTGRFWGAKSEYHTFGVKALRKSILGTATFFVLAVLCVGLGSLLGGWSTLKDYLLIGFLILPLTATVLENIIPFGFDNVAIPLLATLLLNAVV
ncbi:hypothetical protein KC992_03320 [Candidatus Saccharibacteria bacterium]|nr:hypothetical protein [Candidatus Saccharibacteria bacterium]